MIIIPSGATDSIHLADAVFIMNNHRSFEKLNIRDLLQQMNKPALLFDAWQMTPVSDLSANPGITSYGVGTI